MHDKIIDSIDKVIRAKKGLPILKAALFCSIGSELLYS